MPLPKLRDELAKDPKLPRDYPIPVHCIHCKMSMWSTSDSARVEADGSIVCTGCVPDHEN